VNGYQPQQGDRVRARRYEQPTLNGSDPSRELQHEWTGTADGVRGMITDEGEYIDFGYVFLGGNPSLGTCAYAVTEVEPLGGSS
jgi:hypothetical protein